jgi:fructoselysine-6-P-deglycase FrlB-like protein/hydroxymethylpyrimidine pyrophosphatase-like HAD family hydrolase
MSCTGGRASKDSIQRVFCVNQSTLKPQSENKAKVGKPYQSELLHLESTFRWSLSLDTDSLAERLRALGNYSLLAVGSGGSLSTAHLIADLHQNCFGQLAKAETPLLARAHLDKSRSCAVVLVSAQGRNPDILGLARAAVESEPKSVIALCASRDSPLAQLVNAFSRGFCFEFELASGKDGFLATNSLLALSTVALSAYGFGGKHAAASLRNVFGTSGRETGRGFPRVSRSFLECQYLVVLYGPESQIAALDLESKLIEAGLVSVQLSDYRNFAHGRHHWIAKNPNTAVLALAAKDEIPLASHTLGLLPATVQKLLVKTKYTGPPAWLALQAFVFELVGEYGKVRKIDPGRPGVPAFGRRVYHFNAFHKKRQDTESVAIQRKISVPGVVNRFVAKKFREEYSRLSERFCNTRFHGIVLDYDGTICDSVDRFGPIPDETVNALHRFTRAGLLLGVATGRGKSVRTALRDAFPESHWKRIWVGYYNGGAVARLDDTEQPDICGDGIPQLRSAAKAMQELNDPSLQLSIRPQQITVESSNTFDVHELWYQVLQCLQESKVEGLKVVVSTRSVDIVPMTTTKLTVLRALNNVRPGSTLLCIGDRPRWPGNDAELLSHDFSLSVDEVEGSPTGAWNLAPAGVLGSAALRYYLRRITIRSGHFEIRLGSQ